MRSQGLRQGKRRGGHVLTVVLLVTLPVSAALLKVWVQQEVVQLGYALAAEESRTDFLRASEHELEVEMAAMRSPAALVRLANRLGLHPPAAAQRVRSHGSAHLAQADAGSEHGKR